MKSVIIQFASLLALVVGLTLPAVAADGHDHSHDSKSAGPNGGRVLTSIEPHLEFYVTKERKVEITALTEDLKVGKLAGQVIAVTAGERSNPVKMEFKEEAGKLVSTNTLPEGNDFPVSVSVKADATSKAVYAKFNLNLSNCPSCKYQEYACICAH